MHKEEWIAITGANEARNGFFTFTQADVWNQLKPRDPYGNKGTFGKALIIAGSYQMAGAAILSAKAALRGGCGMVRVVTVECNRIILQTACPESLLGTYEEGEARDGLQERLYAWMDWADAVLIGPGLSMSDTAKTLLELVCTCCKKPLIIDADGLNLLARELDLLEECPQDVILTPHMGEMSRLLGCEISEITGHMTSFGEAFAEAHRVVLALKNARSVVCAGNHKTYLNSTGNDGMATAGSGDVLAGLMVSLLAQGYDAYTAACLGMYIHGAAGDLMAEEVGRAALMASDLWDGIGKCLLKFERLRDTV
ncbi:MAG: NAD(P)H-hydrate dehydratase [Lachnospiraceae bacterium]|nr:NAD(P)H-hydrate dehydratase [Lachnospiraceae bacterium]